MFLLRWRFASVSIVAWMVLVLALCAVVASPVHAQVQLQKPANVWGPYSHWFPKGQTGWEVATKPSTAAASGASGSGGAVVVNKAGTAVITQPRLPSINVPVNVATRVPGAAAAAAAARAATVARAAMGPVGAAWLGWQIYNEVKDSGVTICPPPDFFCKPTIVDYDRTQRGWIDAAVPYNDQAYRWTIDQFIANKIASNNASNSANNYSLTKTEELNLTPGPRLRFTLTNARNGFTTTVTLIWWSGVINKTETPGAPLTDAEVEKAVTDRIKADSSGAAAKKAYDAAMVADVLMREAGKQGLPQSVMQPAGSESTLTTPPFTSPETVIGTKQIIDAQGNPQTVTNTSTTTVTPVVNGTGHETSITYNITYNTTNSTTTGPDTPPKVEKETIIIRIEPDAAPPQEQLEIPTDYNREVTQQSILEILRSWSQPPDGALPDGTAEVEEIQAKNAEGLAIVDDVSADGIGLSNWFPTVPTAPCVNPQIPNPVTGAMVSFPICGYVDTFSKFISGVICFFCVLGCVHQVQSAFKA